MGWFRDIAREIGNTSAVGFNLGDRIPGLQTDYQANSGNRKETKRREAIYRQQLRDKEAKNLIETGKSTGSVLSGTEDEQRGQLAGLNLAALGYGQGLGDIGKDIQEVRSRLKEDARGADPVSEAIRAEKSGALANYQRQMRSSGVGGAAAAGAAAAIDRQKSAQIAQSMYGQRRQTTQDMRTLAGNTLSGTVALMQGGKAENVKMPSAPSGGGLFDSVICTELHSQKLMPTHIYLKDSEYGRKVPFEVKLGYVLMASPLVTLMKKSSLFTNLIKYPALSWAYHIAGEKPSMFGKLCQLVGEPICGLVGKAYLLSKGNKYV